jgi:hypothetical protein
MSNLNDFTNPQLKVIKSKQFDIYGIDHNDGPTTITLDANTTLLRIFQVSAESSQNFRLTLDGTEPSQANVDNLISFFHVYSKVWGSGGDNHMNNYDTLCFETKVSGGETMKIAHAGSDTTWQDTSGGPKKLLVQQLSY